MKKQKPAHKQVKLQNGTVKKLVYDYGYDQGKQDTLNKIKYLLETRKIASLDELAHNIFSLDTLSKKEEELPDLSALIIEGDTAVSLGNIEGDDVEKVIITNPNMDETSGKDAIGHGPEKKRGRKRKTFIHAKLTDTRYSVLWDEIYNGSRILVDKLSNAFSYDLAAPRYLGQFTLDGKIDFSVPYATQ